MKFLIFLFCILPIIFASTSKKYYGGNDQNFYLPHFQQDFYYSSPTKSQNIESIPRLTVSLLHDIYIRAGKTFNIVFSPLSIWTVMAMLVEGSSGKTKDELETKLQLHYNSREERNRVLRSRVKEILNFNKGKNGPTEFAALNFVITDKGKLINPEYKNIIQQYYNGRHFELDNRNIDKFSTLINSWASQVSQNKIRSLVSPDMLNNLVLVIGNSVYFKSKWKYPFDPTMTTLMPFKNEYERPITNIPMMSQVAVLPYTYNSLIDSEILEIPYADDLTSMIVILPRERVGFEKVLFRMKQLNINQIIPKNITEETVQLILPRFQITSNMQINDILKQDLRSMFSPQRAEFPFIGKNIYVSKVTHSARIENTEEGTTSSALTSVQFAYKSSSTIFRANRPFIYLITDIKTRTILFAGTYSNPFIG